MDSFGVKIGKAVRRKGNFGQLCCENPKSCQKERELWTALVEEAEKLSEAEGTLDSIGVKIGKAVRRRGNFGQLCCENRKSCQKEKELWTALV
ncbi:hypothetical protein [Mesobacillus jeotgali]|uniref:hypothetical protein n=1 Tax=Mesobacillus jeotgali TaxID=129985 RepID=UPI0009A5F71C|nr:hypothetical protein [Mesobacillus jeotgali]